MRVTMMLRRRAKRGLCVVLGCYALFLLFSLTSHQEEAASDPIISLSPERRGGRAALSDHHHQDGEREEDKDGGGDTEGEEQHEALLPEALDRAIQQQPGAPAVRKKLSRLEPQQVNVVVEDAQPETFAKHRPFPKNNASFKDLRPEESGQIMHPMDRLKLLKREEEEGEKVGKGKKTVMVKAHPLDRLRAMRRGGKIVNMDIPVPRIPVVLDVNPEKDDSGFRNLEPEDNEEASEEAVRDKGVWLAPDGTAGDLQQVNTDSLLVVGQQPHLDPSTSTPDRAQSLQTASMLNISISQGSANFQELADVTVYSAFYDDRLSAPLVRMLAVGPTSRRPSAGSLWCVFAAESSEPSKVSFRQTADCKRMKKYCFYMLHCQVPAGVHYHPGQSNNSVVLVAGKGDNHALNHRGERLQLNVIVNVKRPSTSDQSAVFSVCVPPLYGRVSVVQLVEFVELNRLLGAAHFTFYKFRASREVAQVLAFYEVAGVATVLPWNLPAPNDVWSKGQGLAAGDCLFRNMHLVDFVAFHDLDEVMVPRQAPTWRGLIQTIHEQSEGLHSIAAVYELLTVNFYALGADGKPPSSRFAATIRQSDVDKFATLRNILRGSVLSANLTKLLVRPERVLELDVHSLVTPISELFVSYKVDPHAASVHHYKYQACGPETEAASSTVLNCNKLSEDRTVWHYKNVLVERTKAVLQKLYHS